MTDRQIRKHWSSITLFLTLLGSLTYLFFPDLRRAHCHGGCREACKHYLRMIGISMELYYIDHQQYPRNLESLLPDYLQELPTCHRAERQTYRAQFGRNAPCNDQKSKHYYIIECTGLNHDDVSLPCDFPVYNSVFGSMERPL